MSHKLQIILGIKHLNFRFIDFPLKLNLIISNKNVHYTTSCYVKENIIGLLNENLDYYFAKFNQLLKEYHLKITYKKCTNL